MTFEIFEAFLENPDKKNVPNGVMSMLLNLLFTRTYRY